MNRPRFFTVTLLACVSFAFLSVTHAQPDARTTSANHLGLKLVRIPAGSFVGGSPATEKERSPNETQHAVTITQPFWLSATHVTVAQFETFVRESGHRTAAETQGYAYGAWSVETNGWTKLPEGSWKNPGFKQAGDHPVVCVTWNDARAFCFWLSAKEGHTYRLPTEAEWEYACRAGGTTAYPWGENPDDGKGWANCSGQETAALFTLFPAFTWPDGFQHTAPVASFRANAWGLHDMIGNALQWCGDWYAEYPAGAAENPHGPPEGKERILRGGAFIYGPRHCRSAFRGRNFPDFQNFYVGFRVVREATAEEERKK
ncbi:MAG TPA: formylglycine-generating enzyme family protein [Opitutaceae bacterium]|nr:formylglycine-generating enzyme family protein [Opitutaceae bacterium]